MTRLFKFLRLNHCNRYLLIKTLILLGLVNGGLWLLPFSILRRILDRISQPNPKASLTPVHKIIWAVDVSTNFIPGAKCLARALTCQVLMNQRGDAPELRIGVTKDEEGKLKAHAWLEHQGKVIIGSLSNLSSYTPLPTLPRSLL
ncbi:lasso peptide biosynthesis B2 protein [Aliinostoc sp. HNIBRCY26]|uniref:lasso peptide biosynthesis B2 protein n=1 Tax=Aliinostoc sp. HNIBRCY26 TaxID=3418997 RepID=UPI003D0648F5